MIEKLLSNGENENLDYKQRVNNLFKIAKTISSFANTSGGKILVGINDDGSVIGIDPEEEKYMVQQAADFYCDPPVQVSFAEFEMEEDHKLILLVNITESNTKPHYVKNKYGNWSAYIRCKDRSLPAGKKQIEIIKKGIADDKKNVKMGRNEEMLLNYLEKHDRITIKQFMQLVNISKRRAFRIITDLLMNGSIRIHEHEKEEYYTF